MGNPETQVNVTESSDEPTPDDLAAITERQKLRIRGYITLLKDPNLNYRWRAAEALGNEGDVTAVEPLMDALKDPLLMSSGLLQNLWENWGISVLSNL